MQEISNFAKICLLFKFESVVIIRFHIFAGVDFKNCGFLLGIFACANVLLVFVFHLDGNCNEKKRYSSTLSAWAAFFRLCVW